jgi:hypothetical protein
MRERCFCVSKEEAWGRAAKRGNVVVAGKNKNFQNKFNTKTKT